ncbi:MAG: GntR family transcriptional regulator [Acidimicrobiales bacterium]
MEIDKQLEGSESAPPAIVFRLEPASGVPTYLQLVHQVEHALRLGYLARGDQLPRVKDVVALLSINPNTVLKAYRDLEQKGLIAGRPGQGTFILVSPETVGLAQLTALRRQLVSGWLREAAAAGLDEQGIVALFMAALRDFHDRLAESSVSGRLGAQEGEGAA